MIIRKMQADFGCLEGKSLELEPGLNIIRQPNESGKSTWCAFIRAMLYGIDTSERQKAGFLRPRRPCGSSRPCIRAPPSPCRG